MPKVNAKIDYACKALLELALHWPNKSPLQIDEIGKRQQIPHKFLTQILLNLKQLGYVDSIRGKNGGYLLILAPREIKLNDVISGLGGMGYSLNNRKAKSINHHVMDTVWQDIDETIANALKEVNFEIIRQRARSQEHVMMYGI